MRRLRFKREKKEKKTKEASIENIRDVRRGGDRPSRATFSKRVREQRRQGRTKFQWTAAGKPVFRQVPCSRKIFGLRPAIFSVPLLLFLFPLIPPESMSFFNVILRKKQRSIRIESVHFYCVVQGGVDRRGGGEPDLQKAHASVPRALCWTTSPRRRRRRCDAAPGISARETYLHLDLSFAVREGIHI